MDGIRKSSLAGSWYPADPKVLKKNIADFFQQVPEYLIEGKVIGIVAPHAGYMYSGEVAAHAFKQIQGQIFDTVIVIGPSHRIPFNGVSAYDGKGYETPLGIVSIDDQLTEQIISKSASISVIPHIHLEEHSIEIQLPFLQVVLNKFTFVPLIMGSQDQLTCEELSQAIYSVTKDKNVLLVGSSDLSHFHSYNEAKKMDAVAITHLDRLEHESFLKDLKENVFEACGGGPAAVVMKVAEKLGARRSKLLKYANSGDITGDKRSVVGYAAAVFYAGEQNNDEKGEYDRLHGGAGTGLTEDNKNILLKIVKDTIAAKLQGATPPKVTDLPEILKQERGAFVCLKKKGMLRGCIGYIEARKPLYMTIKEMAVSAAFNDPRFPPLKQGELKDITAEISVLSPLKEIKDISEIEIGHHGLYIVKGFCGGLLLPQVAVECNWDKMTFLRETCHKAGLPGNAWEDKDTKIYIFSADIFSSRIF